MAKRRALFQRTDGGNQRTGLRQGKAPQYKGAWPYRLKIGSGTFAGEKFQCHIEELVGSGLQFGIHGNGGIQYFGYGAARLGASRNFLEFAIFDAGDFGCDG